MKTSKQIPIADVISLYSNKLVSQDYQYPLEGYMNTAIFIAGQSLHFIEVYGNKENFQKYLSESYPWLKDLQFPNDLFEEPNSKEKICNFVEKLKELYGNTLEIELNPNIITGDVVDHLINAGFKSENVVCVNIEDDIIIMGEENSL